VSRASADFLDAWRAAIGDADILPVPEAAGTWLDAMLLEKAMAQVEYRLVHQPDQIGITLGIVSDLLESAS
jgi:predicted trehalose synthase